MISPLPRLVAAWRLLRRRAAVDRALDDELHAALDLLVDERVAAGMDPERARRSAAAELRIEQTRERVIAGRPTAWLDALLLDAAVAARGLRRTPGFTATATATLAIGIAAATTTFAVVDQVALRPLPYAEPSRLVAVDGLGYKGEYVELRQRSLTMDVAMSGTAAPVTLTGQGDPVRLQAAHITADLADVLRSSPLLGRSFTAAEGPGSVLISQRIWAERFGADTGVIGRGIVLDGLPHVVIGVMPRSFGFPTIEVDVWRPMRVDPGDRVALWSTGGQLIGRLRAPHTVDSARSELALLGPQMRALFPWQMPPDHGRTATATPLQQQRLGPARRTLLVLMGAVGVVLLLVCVNVGGLMLARGVPRRHEMALRVALGASRSRVLQQVLVESALVGLTGGLLGVLFGVVGLRVLLPLLPADLPLAAPLTVDGRVLAVSVVLTLTCTLLAGLIPGMRAIRIPPGAALGDSVRGGTSNRNRRRLSQGLVVAEVGLAVVLVFAAALLAQSLWRLIRVSPGFEPAQLVTAMVVPPAVRATTPAAVNAYFDGLLSRVSRLPGISGAALTDRLPFSGGLWGSVFIIEGRPDPATAGGEWPIADIRAQVTPSYLHTLGGRVIAGRWFTEHEQGPSAKAVVLSAALARQYWGRAEAAVGARLTFPGPGVWRTVVGVVEDAKWRELDEPAARVLFVPFGQFPTAEAGVLVRTDEDPRSVRAALGGIATSLDRDSVVDDFRTMEARVAASVGRPRFAALMLAFFSTMALLLGALGVYGLMTESVASRTREIGIRLALGARANAVLGMVLREGLLVGIAGAVLGIAGSLGLSSALSGLLYDISPADPATAIIVPVVLTLVAVLASYVPAHRAARVDPVTAIKVDP